MFFCDIFFTIIKFFDIFHEHLNQNLNKIELLIQLTFKKIIQNNSFIVTPSQIHPAAQVIDCTFKYVKFRNNRTNQLQKKIAREKLSSTI